MCLLDVHHDVENASDVDPIKHREDAVDLNRIEIVVVIITSIEIFECELFDGLGARRRLHAMLRFQNGGSSEPEYMRKLFIGGLDYKTTEATLKVCNRCECFIAMEP